MVGSSYLGYFAEESAQDEIENSGWFGVTKRYCPMRRGISHPKTGARTVSVKYGTYQEKLEHISTIFKMRL
jgi:hypothetical protein